MRYSRTPTNCTMYVCSKVIFLLCLLLNRVISRECWELMRHDHFWLHNIKFILHTYMFFWIFNEKLNCTHLIRIKNNICVFNFSSWCIWINCPRYVLQYTCISLMFFLLNIVINRKFWELMRHDQFWLYRNLWGITFISPQ